jgi:PAS domain S-box-containing protein
MADFAHIHDRRRLPRLLDEEPLRLAVDTLPVIVWTCDAGGEVTFLNRAWRLYTGAAEDEHLGRGWMRAVHPDDAKRLPARWRETIRAGHPFEMDLRIRGREGSCRWFRARGTPAGTGGEPVVRWVVAATDIDDGKEAEEDLRRGRGRRCSST